MSEPTPPPESAESAEPATGPVFTSPPSAEAPPPMPVMPPQPGYAPESNRLNKVAAWVGIIAGAVIIVAVIFGTGFFVGKQVGDGSRGYEHGHQMVLRPAQPFPMAPRGEFGRGPGPGIPGPFGPRGPMIEIPQSPDGPSGPGQGGPEGPPRP